ncbi:MAG: hypothetical protein VX278_21050 [Myxococcota bacterium]|nr:hypothetical protein [Myxococcota bacterium]
MLALFFLACESSTDLNLEYGTSDADDSTDAVEECTPLEGSYEFFDPAYKLGPLAFQMQPDNQTFQSTDTIHEMGMNTISLRFIMPIDSEGRLKYPYVRNHLYYASLEDQICQMGNTIHALKEEGFAIILSGEPHYHSKEEWMELHPDWDGNYSSIVLFETEEMIDNFIAESDPLMQAINDMANRYKVEILSPISETDRFFPPARSDEFMRDTLRNFETYEGQLLWQVYGDMLREPDMADSIHRIDFSDYDLLGLALIGCDGPLYEWDIYMDTLVEWGLEDNVSEIFISEIGCVREPSSVDTAVSNFNYWYDKAASYSTGTIILDTPQGTEGNQGIADTWLEEWARAIAQEQGLLE